VPTTDKTKNKTSTFFKSVIFSAATSTPNNQCFLPNNYVKKGIPTPTTTTQQTPKHNPNKKHNSKHKVQKASGAFLFNNNQRKEKT
jgi:hypothetical protein